MNNIDIMDFAASLSAYKNCPNVGCIDVRTVEEYKACHIDGVQNIPLQQLVDRQSELESFRTIYIHCRSGNRSAKAVTLLSSFDGKIFDFCGGMNAWKAAGYPVVKAKKSAWRQWIDWVVGK